MSYETDMTIEYYDKNTEEYFESTSTVDMSEARNRFLKHIPPDGLILDFGCGSGRDTKAFADAGYNAVALDGSQALCVRAHGLTHQPVICCQFQNYKAVSKFDGIWACASLLHLTEEELLPVLEELEKSLKTGGVLYTSFKYGDFSGERNGRWFTDMTEEKLEQLVSLFADLARVEQWVSADARPERQNEKWLNVIYQKQ